MPKSVFEKQELIVTVMCQTTTPINYLVPYTGATFNAKFIPGHYPEHIDLTNLEKVVSQIDPTRNQTLVVQRPQCQLLGHRGREYFNVNSHFGRNTKLYL